MRIKFYEDQRTVNYGRVVAGEPVEVTDEDGQAFIDNGLAKKTKAKMKDEEAVDNG